MSRPPAQASASTLKATRPSKASRPIARGEASDGRASMTREGWVQAATEVLVLEGIDAVRVDALAKALGVTRGSFYWHFRDRDELLGSILEAWRIQTTEALTQRLERASAEPLEQLRDVLSLPHRGDSAQRVARIELAIRAWARRNQVAKAAVDEADAARMAYIAQIFSALGFAPSEARHRAVLVYSMNVACSQLSLPQGQANTDALTALAHRLFASKP